MGTISSRIVYMCHDDPFKDEQCMKVEKLGSNTFYWVRKCKGSQICVRLPYYGGIIGGCSIKVRSHYDGESCANNNKCTSGVCDGTKCKGKTSGQRCEIGLGQCKKGLLCRKSSSSDAYSRCLAPIENGVDCTGTSESVTSSTSDDNTYWLMNDKTYFNPAYNPCKLGYVCSGSSSAQTCVKIGSVSNGNAATNPLACSSGYITIGGTTCAAPSTDTYTTAMYVTYTAESNITTHFNEWKNEMESNGMKDEDAIYEAYRYTRKKKKINELWFRYTHSGFVQDADECAYDYMWKSSNTNTLKFSLMIFAFILLF